MNKLIKNIEKEMMPTLFEVLKYKSVKNEGENNTLFGQEINDVLEYTLNVAKELGFKTFKHPEGYYGYAEVGEGELFGILGHLDVVPAGDLSKWNTDPFEPTIKDGYLYARGASDDKGPMIMNLYAIKALMDEGHIFNKRVRMIFGTDEEVSWKCIEKYMEEEEVPSFGYTPDADFPVIYAEAGITQYSALSSNGVDFELIGGNAVNATADWATYIGPKMEDIKNLLNDYNFEYEMYEEKIKVLGKSSHAKDPHEGVNAISRLVKVVYEAGIHSEGIDFIYNKIGLTFNGELIAGDVSDDVIGKLTLNLGKVKFDSNSQEVNMDSRVPVKHEINDILNIIKVAIKEFNMEYREDDYLEKIYLDENNFMVANLLKVYEDVTGETAKPLTTGGGTYARSMPNCVAFGALFQSELATEHQPNERIKVSDISRALEIYYEAIKRLTK